MLDWSAAIGAAGLLLAAATAVDSRRTKTKVEVAERENERRENTSELVGKSFDHSDRVLTALQTERTTLVAEVARVEGRCDSLQAQLTEALANSLKQDREIGRLQGLVSDHETTIANLTARLAEIGRRSDLIVVPSEDRRSAEPPPGAEGP